MTLNNVDCHRLVANNILAWNSLNPEKVFETYAHDACFIINRGEPMNGHADIAEMTAGFIVEFPDMVLTCDNNVTANDHMVYTWIFEGHQDETKNFFSFKGWEEWELNAYMTVQSSLGWYDAAEYERQVAEGVK